MLFASGLSKLRWLSNLVSSWLYWVANGALLLMAAVTVVDIVGLKAFRMGIPGCFEIVTLAQVITIGGAMAFTQIVGRHVRLELVGNRLPKLGRAVLYIFTSLVGLGLFGMLGWQSFMYGQSLRVAGLGTMEMELPVYLFVFWVSLCCISMCLVLLVELLNWVAEVAKK